MKIVLLGPPGCGKGTQAQRLAARFGVKAVATGNLLREAVRRGTPLGARAKDYMNQGKLVPDEVLVPLVQEQLEGLEGFVLDGFPRTVAQAAALDRTAPDAVAVRIEVAPDTLVGRLSGRRVCPSCSAVYHLVTGPPKKAGICDKCSTPIVQREDDKPEVVRKRQEVYGAETAPVVERFRRYDRLRTVDGEGSPDAIFERIVWAVGG